MTKRVHWADHLETWKEYDPEETDRRSVAERGESALLEAVRNEEWEYVGRVLREGPFSDQLRRWALTESLWHATDLNLTQDIFPHCPATLLESVLEKLVQEGLWSCIAKILLFSDLPPDAERRVMETACLRCPTEYLIHLLSMQFTFKGKLEIPATALESVLEDLVQEGLWSCIAKFLSFSDLPPDDERRVMETACLRCPTEDLIHLLKFAGKHNVVLVLMELSARGIKQSSRIMQSTLRNKLKNRSFQDVADWCVHCFVQSLRLDSDTFASQTDDDALYEVTASVNLEITTFLLNRLKSRFQYKHNGKTYRRNYSKMVTETYSSTLFSVCGDGFLPKIVARLFTEYYNGCVAGTMHIDIASIVTAVFAVQNISQKFQTLALARLPRVQELVRRAVFKEVVIQRDWKSTKLLADHSLYDDQRGWALGEALNERQWDVVVVLAEHGLTEDQLRKVYRQVAKRAGLDTVRQLYDQAVDMRVVCEELMAANPSRDRPPNKEAIDRLRNRGEDVTKLEAEYRERRERVAKAESEHKKRCSELEELDIWYSCCGGINFEHPLSSKQWYGRMSKLRRFAERPTGDCIHLVDKAIEHAIADNAWHVVMHLVRFGMDASKRDSVFLQALKQNQWGVARLLLEYGVSVELSRAALPELMEANQWILVARVMELSLDDTERRLVMQAALDKKEGSVVAHGISVMEGRLSVEEREVMYDQALSQGVWQAVKRLVEEKDNTGIAQRDEALVSAVEHRQWDIVAHCELHGADMDKQGSDGDTMLLREVKDSDFEAVTELVQLGANQLLADVDDLRVLDIAIDDALKHGGNEAWDTVKLLVEFHGDINRPDPTGRSPLHKLIASRNENVRIADNEIIPDGVIKARIIDTALLWGRDVCQKEASFYGKTALHVVSRAGLWDTIRYLVARGADPLSVTKEGMTMLWMGVKNESCPKKLLQECIKLGVSTHQPAISHTAERVVPFPMFAALKKRSLELARMLYESGACSGPDLYRLKTNDRINRNRAKLRLATKQKPFKSDEDFSGQVHTPGDNIAFSNGFGSRQAELKDLNKIEELAVLEYIHQIATTPRRLTSLCRVAISHYVGVWKPRERNKRVEKLPLPRPMKDYVLFRDLTRT